MTADGWTIHRFTTVDSTQRVAAELIAQGAPHRTVIVADCQTAGYGRKGGRWLDEPGDSLLVTLVLRPTAIAYAAVAEKFGSASVPGNIHTVQPTHYLMAAALAALEAIREVTGAQGAIKWPNDLLLGGRKVGGILGDATWTGGKLEAYRIGLGLNLRGDRASFAARALPGATSIASETGRCINRATLLDALLRRFVPYDDALMRDGPLAIVIAWRQALITIGQAVTATLTDGRTIRGAASDVSDYGDLVVVTETGETTYLTAPEVQTLRPCTD